MDDVLPSVLTRTGTSDVLLVDEDVVEEEMISQIEKNRRENEKARRQKHAKKHIRFLTDKIRDFQKKQKGLTFLDTLKDTARSRNSLFNTSSTLSDDEPTEEVEQFMGMRFDEDQKKNELDLDQQEEEEKNDNTKPLLPFNSWNSSVCSYGATLNPRKSYTQQLLRDTSSHSLKKHKSKCWRLVSGLFATISPKSLYQGLCQVLFHSTITFVAVPATIASFFLFYCLGNPSVPFHQKAGAISWWLLFFARQSVMLELARVLEYFTIHGVMLQTNGVIKVLGPFVTLFAIQSSGWPFVLTLWAISDLVFLHGSNDFQQNWFGFAQLKIFSSENEGGWVLTNGTYLRILVAALLAGLAHSVKRFLVAMYFGKRALSTYRQRLEKIMSDIFLVAEAAHLPNSVRTSISARSRASDDGLDRLRSIRTNFRSDMSISGHSEEDDSDEDTTDKSTYDTSDDDDDGDNVDAMLVSAPCVFDDLKPTRSSIRISSMGKLRSGDGPPKAEKAKKAKPIQDHFDLLEEHPIGTEGATQASILDILNFQRALSHMDDEFPFTESFGPVKSRAQCLKGSQHCFSKLAKLQKDSVDPLLGNEVHVIPFDTFKAVATADDGTIIEDKLRALKTLFNPDKDDEVTELTFVRSIDTVYKQMRFFRASVANFSKIDEVLGDVIDILFHSLVCFLLMLLLDFNPYPLLVSISTLMVSFAFAFGPSASKYIEGILLIAIRRPYDLGDRILVSAADTSPPIPDTELQNAAALAWTVEDINLFQTTLRFVPTNEVASISNGSIAMARIVNFARSPNALITLRFEFNKRASRERIAQFYVDVERFVKERPSQWDRIMSFQLLRVESDHLKYQLRVRHIGGWQDTSFVSASKAELLNLCHDNMKQLDIGWNSNLQKLFIQGENQPSSTSNNLGHLFPIVETDAKKGSN